MVPCQYKGLEMLQGGNYSSVGVFDVIAKMLVHLMYKLWHKISMTWEKPRLP